MDFPPELIKLLQAAKLFWKQFLIGGYAVLVAARGVAMLLIPRAALNLMRRMKNGVARLFGFRRRVLPHLSDSQQVLAMRTMGVLSIAGAGAVLWWLIKGIR